MECIRCVLPSPTPPYRNNGLYTSPGDSATAREAAWAKLLFPPTTNVSNVYLGFNPAFSAADFVFFFWLASIAIFWISSSLSSSSEMNITSNSVPVISAIHTLRGRRYFFSIYSTLAFIFTNINTVLSITSYTFKGCIHVVKDTLDNSCSILRCSIISGHFSCTMFISANS